MAALASKSHHRNDRDYSDASQLGGSERGHRDGLHAQTRNDYGKNNDYREGHQSGVEERCQQTQYRNHDRYRSGYSQQAILAALSYPDKRRAEGRLSSRGFARTGGHELPGGGNSIGWWNGPTQRCVNVSSRNNQISSVEQIAEGNCQ